MSVEITQKLLHDLIFYNPVTGDCYWKKRDRKSFKRNQDYLTWNKMHSYNKINGIDKNGYKRICIDYKFYKLHRIIWMYVYGKWPDGVIDHIDRDSGNNKISNLRDTNKIINAINSDIFITNTSGRKGVSWHKQRKKWRAYYNQYHLGLYDDINDAIKVRAEYVKDMFEKNL